MAMEPLLIVAGEDDLATYRSLPLWEAGDVAFLALDASVATSPDLEPASLLLLDCGESDLEGLDLLRAIKGCHPDIPVIFLTNANSEETVIAAFRLGARDYFKKPCNLLELKRAVDQLLPLRRRARDLRTRQPTSDETGSPSGRLPSDLPVNLQRVVARIMKEFHLHLSVDLLAREACLSKFHFCRLFRRTLGTSPMDFVLRLRIERAKAMLRMRLPVIQIALRTGFGDASNFSRQFRRLTGMTPTAYRSSLQDPASPPPPPRR